MNKDCLGFFLHIKKKDKSLGMKYAPSPFDGLIPDGLQ